MTQFDRPKGRMVHYLNVDTIKPALVNALEERGIPVTEFEVDRMVVVRTKNNGYAVVCNEGVGWQVNPAACLPIMVWSGGGWRQDFIDLPFREVVLHHVSDETVDLAEFVRMFGARLENNFHIWYNATDGVEQVFEKVVANV